MTIASNCKYIAKAARTGKSRSGLLLLMIVRCRFFAIFRSIKCAILAPIIVPAVPALCWSWNDTPIKFLSVCQRTSSVHAGNTNITFTIFQNPSSPPIRFSVISRVRPPFAFGKTELSFVAIRAVASDRSPSGGIQQGENNRAIRPDVLPLAGMDVLHQPDFLRSEWDVEIPASADICKRIPRFDFVHPNTINPP